MTLPKELEEEFDKQHFSVQTELGVDFPVYDVLPEIKEFVAKTYAAGVKAGLMEAREMAGEEGKEGVEFYNGSARYGDEGEDLWGEEYAKGLDREIRAKNAYRTELLSRLEKRLNDGVQE